MDQAPRIRVFRVLPGLIDTTLGGQEIRSVYALFTDDTTAEYVDGPTGPEFGLVRVYENDLEIREMKLPGPAIKKAIEDKPDVFRLVISRVLTDRREGRGRIWTIERVVDPDHGRAHGFAADDGGKPFEIPPWATEELSKDRLYTSLEMLRDYRNHDISTRFSLV